MCCLLWLSLVLSYLIEVNKGQEKMEVYRASGSSMFFPGVPEDDRDLAKFFQWEVCRGNAENETTTGVVQFHAGDTKPSLLKKYIGRLDFFPSNGSFVLQNLTSSDEGLYMLFINLRKVTAQTVRLQITDQLSKASILSNSSSLASTISLTCDVSGKPHGYQWQKDGKEISRPHQLMNRNRSLIIPSARKGDCGTYTCIAINPVSFTQADYTLTIYGIPPEQIVIIVASFAGLILSLVPFIGLIRLCWFKRNTRQASLRQYKLLFLSLFSSNILSLVAIFTALAFWIVLKGAAPMSVVAICFVAILLIFAVTASIAIWNPDSIRRFLGNTSFRASLDVSGIICSFIVIAISVVILAEEIQQNNQGCHVIILAWSTLAPLMVLLVIIFSVYFVIWRCGDGARSQGEQQGGRELQSLNGINADQEPEPEYLQRS
ncbi:uncharacterized protein LOC121291396 [Carcharodon carcharias]|uniref:uncharacterized protein LOC121291396 n=1 Tax=Carcharodon carcharias TaxID=13397 RepID=UPI001B7E6440|nr:uncharacterized protein LOC121291396 [Carcharodon carcharias]